ncbi:MAG TPA: aminopeptidase P N-terminal domain-containing protein [Saprospiraceae bacterium]|nr:aminopeptidase P N-terminal domain-containing protein [Saprospiraceae bacterium]HNT22473.1 aminopeptidase P N-terminal domain-containing protein [Saprospiraceae bacterium]
MQFHPLSPATYQAHRNALGKDLDPEGIAILHSNDRMPRTADQYFPFRQNSDLLRLCGIYQGETVLVLFPDHPDPEKRELLFIQRTSEHMQTWDGEALSKVEAIRISGIEQVHWTDQFENLVYPLVARASQVYLNSNEKADYPQNVLNRNERLGLELLRQFPFHTVRRLQPLLKKLSLVKSPEEIEAIRAAARLTGQTWKKISRLIKPGMYEFELAAEITYQFEKNGAVHAFDPIVASGPSACTLHYKSNHQKIRAEDLILVDFGAELNGYSADMTRCKAVDGTMNARQFAVYDQVVNLFQQARLMLKPGARIQEVNEKIQLWASDALLQLGLASPVEARDHKIIRKYLPHGISHFLGLDVHDYGDRYLALEPGMVLTCEPGLYIREEGIGIRLENDLLITETGNEDLMADYEI